MFDFPLLVSAIVLICLDYVYLQVVQQNFKQQIEKVQQKPLKVNFLGAALCYIFLITGINYFIIRPRKSPSEAFLLGIVIYGVYESTSWALLKDWSIITVVIDTLWGGLLFAATAFITNLLRRFF